LTEDLNVHPADILAQQLDRASSLVRTLADLFAPKSGNFVTSDSFIAHGLEEAATLIHDAHNALEILHQVCDLRILDTEIEVQEAAPEETPADIEDQPMVFPPTEAMAWSSVEKPLSILEPQVQKAATDDQFAQSYLELLRKLTAAEVFAAEQQALAAPGTSGQNLLPLLRSLREEFQKLHRVA
jgi:hypothetical protein